MDIKKHNEKIVVQFTKQACKYTSIASHSDALDLLIDICFATKKDSVLDVACGSGIVACAFAKHVNKVTGIDMTEEMIREAKKLQVKQGVENINWKIGEIPPLPYADNEFSIVISRFGFHHFPEPNKVFKEMIRVCASGGIVMVVDVSLPVSKVDKYNEMEKIRDDSHCAALSIEQFDSLFQLSNLKNIERQHYEMKISFAEQIKASFPSDALKLENMVLNDIGKDQLGVKATQAEDGIYLSYPIYIYSGRK